MNKLYVFAVGGTGARVLKSLIMLMASGAKLNAKMIVPIIMDPHADNEDVKRTIECIRAYNAINRTLGPDNEGFFRTPVKTLKELHKGDSSTDNVVFELNDVDQQRFSDYIDYPALGPADQAMIDLLFSGELQKPGHVISKRDTNMDEGFYGNPDLGSVVLNQFAETEDYDAFASTYNQGDRVMIISSIFGGTGAAGLPVILNNIRNAMTSGHQNGAVLSNAIVGTMIVLPYFSIQNDENSSIKNGDFYVKTRSALSYYYENVSKQQLNKINATYYISDHGGTDAAYPNDPGAGGQKNKAHFTEFAAATGIVDFCGLDGMQTTNAKATGNVYFREFGIEDDQRSVGISHLGTNTKKEIAVDLCQFKLLQLYVDNQLANTVGKQVWGTFGKTRINSSFLDGELMQVHLRDFLKHYTDWEEEISSNARGLKLFADTSDLSNIFRGIEPLKGVMGKKDIGLYDIDHEMNVASSGEFPNAEEKFFSIIHQATRKVLKKNYAVFENII